MRRNLPYKRIAKCINSIPWVQNMNYFFYYDDNGNRGIKPKDQKIKAKYDKKALDMVMDMALGMQFYAEFMQGKKR
jgi:hypothetical protein